MIEGTFKDGYSKTRFFTLRDIKTPVVKRVTGVKRQPGFSTTKRSNKSEDEQYYFTTEGSLSVRSGLYLQDIQIKIFRRS